jgi:hypothetical protein
MLISMYGYPHDDMCVVGLIGAMWQKNKDVKVWKLKRPCSVFERKYDLIQQQLEDISTMDNLLSG